MILFYQSEGIFWNRHRRVGNARGLKEDYTAAEYSREEHAKLEKKFEQLAGQFGGELEDLLQFAVLSFFVKKQVYRRRCIGNTDSVYR